MERYRRFFRCLNNESGMVLVLGMVVTVLLTAMGLAAISKSTTEVKIASNQKISNQLLYAAEAGVANVNNKIWTESNFGTATQVSFDGLDALSYLAAAKPYKIFDSVGVGNSAYFSAAITNYDTSNASQRIVTIESKGWQDKNSNGSLDAGEPSKTIETKIAYSYESMDFPFGVLTQNTECIFCHAKINGDIVSLESMTVRNTDEAYSIITGKVYTAGTTNLDQPNSRVVQDYDFATNTETPLDITTNYTDPRFPLDANGNPDFPSIGNLDYYKGLAAAYNGGAGSTISGGSITGVPTGSTYASKTSITSINSDYAGNLILDGTTSCIVLDGPIVADKDVVIKGCVKGQGNIYAGGNIYVAGAVTYNDATSDKLSLAAGGNVIMGDYRTDKNTNPTGGGDFIEKQMKTFNSDMAANTSIPDGEKRYYRASDGSIPKNGNPSTVTLTAGDEAYGYTPTDNWISTTDYINDLADNTNGVTQLDALVYTSNAIFGINKVGQKKTTINGALVSADIGILIPGPAGKTQGYDPALIGLTLNYDSRLKDFVSVARNPMKGVTSWKEVEASNW